MILMQEKKLEKTIIHLKTNARTISSTREYSCRVLVRSICQIVSIIFKNDAIFNSTQDDFQIDTCRSLPKNETWKRERCPIHLHREATRTNPIPFLMTERRKSDHNTITHHFRFCRLRSPTPSDDMTWRKRGSYIYIYIYIYIHIYICIHIYIDLSSTYPVPLQCQLNYGILDKCISRDRS